MNQNEHTRLVNANNRIKGLIALLHNINDQPLQFVEPFQLAELIQPVADDLDLVLRSN